MNVELRRVIEEDALDLAPLFTDPLTHPYIIENGPLSEDAIEERIDRMASHSPENNTHYWTVCSHGKSAGYVALHNTGDLVPAISYAVLPHLRRRGIPRKAIRQLLETVRSDYSKAAVTATTHLDNHASSALLLAVGFRQEGEVKTPNGTRMAFTYRPE